MRIWYPDTGYVGQQDSGEPILEVEHSTVEQKKRNWLFRLFSVAPDKQIRLKVSVRFPEKLESPRTIDGYVQISYHLQDYRQHCERGLTGAKDAIMEELTERRAENGFSFIDRCRVEHILKTITYLGSAI
jgi:hypothetical protein